MPDTVITVGGDIRDLQNKFNQAGNEVTKLGKKVKTEAASSRGSAFVGDLAGTLRGVVGLSAIKGFVDEFDRVGDIAAKLDTSAESVQRLGNMAKLSATDLETASSAITRLQKNLATADPNDKFVEAMKRLGIDTRTFAALDPDKAVLVLAEAFQAAEKKGTGFADVFDLMGKQAGELIPLLRTSKEQLQELADIPVVSNENIARIQEMNDLFDEGIIRFKAGIASLGSTIGESAGVWAAAFSQTEWKDILSVGAKADEIVRQIAAEKAKERADEEAARQAEKLAQQDELAKQQQVTALKKQAVDLEKSQRAAAEKKDDQAVLKAKATGSRSQIERAEREAKINDLTRKGIGEGLSPVDAREEAKRAVKLQEQIDFRQRTGRRQIQGVKLSEIPDRPSELDLAFGRNFRRKNEYLQRRPLSESFTFSGLDGLKKMNQRDANGRLLDPIGKGSGRELVQANEEKAQQAKEGPASLESVLKEIAENTKTLRNLD